MREKLWFGIESIDHPLYDSRPEMQTSVRIFWSENGFADQEPQPRRTRFVTATFHTFALPYTYLTLLKVMFEWP